MGRGPIIHVVDDDASLRLALQGLLESIGLAAQTYGTAAEFLAEESWDGAGCVLLDVRLPGASGLDLQSRLAALGVDLPVILMSGHGDIAMSVRAMKAGAVDFLTKPFRDQDLLDAVTAALDLDRIRRASAVQVEAVRRRYITLSLREREVMTLVCAGLLNKQIASDLDISEVTVKIHRGAAMRKMGARSLPDLVRMADLFAPEPA